VAGGKVVTYGVQTTLSCLDAATGSKAWRKDALGEHPRFYAASSPIVADGGPGGKLVIVEYGSEDAGGLVAYDLAGGGRQWAWKEDGAAYASPVLATVGGAPAVIAETAGSVVAVSPADGKLLWQAKFRERYNASSPVVDGQTIIYSGPTKGTTAVAVEKSGDGWTAKELWADKPGSNFSTPVVKGGLLFGISDQDQLFCINTRTGKSAWTAPLRKAGGGGRMGRSGYGSVVDAGAVLFALNPSGELVAFEPSDKEFKKLAAYQVAGGETYAYPVIDGKRVFVKDKDSVTLWTMD